MERLSRGLGSPIMVGNEDAGARIEDLGIQEKRRLGKRNEADK